MNKFNLGDIVYFIANGYHIREATIIRKGAVTGKEVSA